MEVDPVRHVEIAESWEVGNAVGAEKLDLFLAEYSDGFFLSEFRGSLHNLDAFISFSSPCHAPSILIITQRGADHASLGKDEQPSKFDEAHSHLNLAVAAQRPSARPLLVQLYRSSCVGQAACLQC